jgi:hypothetical protein
LVPGEGISTSLVVSPDLCETGMPVPASMLTEKASSQEGAEHVKTVMGSSEPGSHSWKKKFRSLTSTVTLTVEVDAALTSTLREATSKQLLSLFEETQDEELKACLALRESVVSEMHRRFDHLCLSDAQLTTGTLTNILAYENLMEARSGPAESADEINVKIAEAIGKRNSRVELSLPIGEGSPSSLGGLPAPSENLKRSADEFSTPAGNDAKQSRVDLANSNGAAIAALADALHGFMSAVGVKAPGASSSSSVKKEE